MFRKSFFKLIITCSEIAFNITINFLLVLKKDALYFLKKISEVLMFLLELKDSNTRCRRLNIPDLLFDCTDRSNVGSACELRCRRGFQLIGERFTNCTADGFSPEIEANSCIRGRSVKNKEQKSKSINLILTFVSDF